ncbi:MAG: hypothetical protein AB7G68_03930 [Nitrospiraceae bacterium]
MDPARHDMPARRRFCLAIADEAIGDRLFIPLVNVDLTGWNDYFQT